MTRSFKSYLAAWVLGVVLLAAVALLVGGQGAALLNNPSWVLYLLCAACMLVQLAATWAAFGCGGAGMVAGADSAEKRLFLGMPALAVSGVLGLVSAVCALVFANVPVVPTWMGALVLVCLLALDVAVCVGGRAAAGYVAAVDGRTREATEAMAGLRAQAASLPARARTEAACAAAGRVSEALAFADPVSGEATAACDAALAEALEAFEAQALAAAPDEATLGRAERAVLDALATRAAACQAGKRR